MGQRNSINNKSTQDDEPHSTAVSGSDANENQDAKSPAVNANYREIIRNCFDKASDITAGRILMRINQQRSDFKAYRDNLTQEQLESLTNLLSDYLSSVIENVDDAEKVKEISMQYGSMHVKLRLNGFKPDFFATMADAIATECSFLSETATVHAPTNTFKAWTLLVDLMFSSVRDGFYQELRRQRRRSPTHPKSSRESSINNEFRDGCSDNSLIDSAKFEADNSDKEIGYHWASPLARNIPNSSVPTVSRPLFQKSNSANNFTKLVSTTGCESVNNYYRNSQMEHIKRTTRARTPTHNSISGQTSGRILKNSTATTNHYSSTKNVSTQSSQPIMPKPFDPNKIIDDFMNDRYKV